MRNRHDFEQLVYQRAEEIKSEDRKKVIRIKAVLSTAAAVCVITVGGISAYTAWNNGMFEESVDTTNYVDTQSAMDFDTLNQAQNGEPNNNTNVDDVVSFPVTNTIDNDTSHKNSDIQQDDSIKTNTQSGYSEVDSMSSYSSVVSENDYNSEAVSSEAENGNSVDGVEITADFDRLYSVQCYNSDMLVAEYFDEETLVKFGEAIKDLTETKGLPSASEMPKYSLQIEFESGAVWVADVYEDMVLINGDKYCIMSDEFKSLLKELNLQ